MQRDISVLISTYNNRQFVPKKLAEIQRQTFFSRAQFIFVETASPERERELLVDFCDAHSNCKLIVKDDRQTLYEAWNLAWAEASSPLLCYSNMDDSMHPRLLEEVVRAMNRHDWAACSVLIAKQSSQDPALDQWTPARLRRLSLSTRPGPFTAWRANIAAKAGKFDGRFIVAGDKDFWSRLQASRLPHGLIWKVLYLYTKTPLQLSKSSDPKRRHHDAALLKTKTYPIQWPGKLRWQILCARWLLPLFPYWFCEPGPHSQP